MGKGQRWRFANKNSYFSTEQFVLTEAVIGVVFATEELIKAISSPMTLLFARVYYMKRQYNIMQSISQARHFSPLHKQWSCIELLLNFYLINRLKAAFHHIRAFCIDLNNTFSHVGLENRYVRNYEET